MARETFGNSWWGEQWLKALTKIDYSNRIPRGKSYARRGMVSELEINNGKISSRVKGSRRTPYNVELTMGVFSNAKMDALLDDLINYPSIVSGLLNGKMDQQLEDVASQHGLNIFPESSKDMKMKCSCPDFAVPCKHIAAVIYKVCSDIDKNPFILFEFRNVDLKRLLDQKGINVEEVGDTKIPKVSDLFSSDHPVVRRDIEDSVIDYSNLKNRREEFLQLLADNPPFYNLGDFKKIYAAQLKKIGKVATKILDDKLDLADLHPDAAKSNLTYDSTVSLVFNENQRLEINGATLSEIWTLSPEVLNRYHPHVGIIKALTKLALQAIAHGVVVPKLYAYQEKYVIYWMPSALDAVIEKALQTYGQSIEVLDENTGHKGDARIATRLLTTTLVQWISVYLDTSYDEYVALFFQGQKAMFTGLSEASTAPAINRWLKLYEFDKGDHYPVLVVDEIREELFGIDIQVGSRSEATPPVTFGEFVSKLKNETALFDFFKYLDLLSAYLPEVGDYMNRKAKSPMTFTAEDFPDFLFTIIPILKLLKVKVVLPKSLSSLIKPKASISVSTSSGEASGILSLSHLMDFDWRVCLGDELVGEKEFLAIVHTASKLIKYKGRYIYIDEADLNRLIKKIQGTSKLTGVEVLQAVLAEDYEGSPIEMTDEVVRLIQKLRSMDMIPPPTELKATLRPYQMRGYSWMWKNLNIGVGSILADDMGLGKTVQVIALLTKLKTEGGLDAKPAIVVLPTSLLPNWQAELEKFAPKLKAFIYYGPKRNLQELDQEYVVLTTYGTLRSDISNLKKLKWSILVIDESQNIKNPSSQQTKAVKSLKADHYVAMSGTPVENRLMDYWSVMDYVNKGLLGTQSAFEKTFVKPINKDGDLKVIERFKNVTAPFIMRRMKTDKSIISDLPEKNVLDTFTTLTVEQSALYQEVLNNAMSTISGINSDDSKELFKRQGLILQMIISLKQICNHPGQWLKDGRTASADSGKLSLLKDKLSTIFENGEKVLIFTQFREMGDIIAAALEDEMGIVPLWLHGGISMKKRMEMVEAFQQMPHKKVMILSLKAGGTGLNLTAANHVIHYDLWWNPAVEAQATDRAFRIGQRKDVFVHRFITKNTFEEKINKLIQKKKTLADLAVTSGEKWIGQMDDRELKELFTMG